MPQLAVSALTLRGHYPLLSADVDTADDFTWTGSQSFQGAVSELTGTTNPTQVLLGIVGSPRVQFASNGNDTWELDNNSGTFRLFVAKGSVALSAATDGTVTLDALAVTNAATLSGGLAVTGYASLNTGAMVTTEYNGGSTNALRLYDSVAGYSAYFRTLDGGGVGILNSAFSAQIINWDDSGDFSVTGYLSAQQGRFFPPGGSAGSDIAVSSAIQINGNYGGATQAQSNPPGLIGWNYTNGAGEVDIIASAAGSGGALNVYKLTGSAAPFTPALVARLDTAGITAFGSAIAADTAFEVGNSAGAAYPYRQETSKTWSGNSVTWTLATAYPSGASLGWGGYPQQTTNETMYLFGMSGATTSAVTLWKSTTSSSYGSYANVHLRLL